MKKKTTTPARRCKPQHLQLLAQLITSEGLTLGELLERQNFLRVDSKPTHWDDMVSDHLGKPQHLVGEKQAEAEEDIFEALTDAGALPAEHARTLIRRYTEPSDAIENAAIAAAFELGRATGRLDAKAGDRRPALERFMDALQAAIGQDAQENGNITEKGKQSQVELFRRAVPVARAIALLGNPLDVCANPLETLVKEWATESAAEDGFNSEDATALASVEVSHMVGIVVGLILADQIGGGR